jgi:hypothetical protein
MNKKITFVLILLLNVVVAFADQVTPEQAKNAAMQFLASRSNVASGTARHAARTRDVYQVYPATSAAKGINGTSAASDANYYIFNSTDSTAFVVIAGESTLTPVLAYSLDGKFDMSNIPDGVRFWLDNYAYQVQLIKDGKATAPSASSSSIGASATGKVLTTALWYQDAPYNNECPQIKEYKTSSGSSINTTQRCVTGCVATAMAIIMKYHQWPAQGFGSNSYTNTVTYNNKTYSLYQSLNFGSKPFDWANMPDNYSSYTTTQGDAVAWLMHCCGVSVDMSYWTESGAQSTDAAKALRNNFRYSHYAHDIARFSITDYNSSTGDITASNMYTDDEWKALIAAEIDADRSVLYSGQTTMNSSTAAGHAFVCDGYDSQGYLHFNFGWGNAYYNCYCDIDNVTPTNSGRIYRYLQDAIIGITPDHNFSASYDPQLAFLTSESRTSGLKSTSSGKIEKGTSFTVTATNVGNGKVNTKFGGLISCGLYSAKGELKEVVSENESITDSLPSTSYFDTFDLTCQIKTATLEKSDRVWLISSSDKGSTWNRVYGFDEASSSVPVFVGMDVASTATDGTQTVSVYGELTTADLTTIKGNESLTTVDLSNATNLGGTVDVTGTNPNAFVKLPAGSTATVTGALVYGANGDITLADKQPIAADGTPTAKSVSYTRSFNTAANLTESSFDQPRWQTICLPFNVTSVTTADGRSFQPADYWLYKMDNGTYVRVKAATSDGVQLAANEPYFIAFINMDGYDKYNVSGDVTFKGGAIGTTAQTLLTKEEQRAHTGIVYNLQSYYGVVASATANYALNDEGTTFMKNSTPQLTPFRPCAVVTSGVKGNTLDAFGNSTTGIGTIGPDTAPDAMVKPVSGGLDIKSRKAGTVTVTTLGGMVLGVYSVGPTTRHIALPIGLCIVNGKKYLVKE